MRKPYRVASAAAITLSAAFLFPFSPAVAKPYRAVQQTGYPQSAPQPKEAPEPSEQRKGWSARLGAGAMVTPEYEGGDKFDFQPLPYVDANYMDVVSFNPFSGLRVNAIHRNGWKAGVGVGANFGRDEDDADHLQGLGDVDPTAEGLLFVGYEKDKWSADVTFAHDLDSGHEGYHIKGEVGYREMLSQRIMLRPSVSTTYASDDYMESFFGVSSAQSARSGLRSFEAEAGLKDISAGMMGSYFLTESWSVNGLVQYKYLLSDAGDSPITEQQNQISGGAFMAYQF
jgi:outer membrane protein